MKSRVITLAHGEKVNVSSARLRNRDGTLRGWSVRIKSNKEKMHFRLHKYIRSKKEAEDMVYLKWLESVTLPKVLQS